MWDFEADLSQTVLDQKCSDKNSRQDNEHISDVSSNTTPFRNSQSQAIDWNSSDEDSKSITEKIDSTKTESTKKSSHAQNLTQLQVPLPSDLISMNMYLMI